MSAWQRKRKSRQPEPNQLLASSFCPQQQRMRTSVQRGRTGPTSRNCIGHPNARNRTGIHTEVPNLRLCCIDRVAPRQSICCMKFVAYRNTTPAGTGTSPSSSLRNHSEGVSQPVAFSSLPWLEHQTAFTVSSLVRGIQSNQAQPEASFRQGNAQILYSRGCGQRGHVLYTLQSLSAFQ
jgi:hypothetical protein